MKYRLLSSVFYEDSKKYEDLYERRFNSESTYQLDFDINNHKAFVVINHNILENIDSILEIDKALQELRIALPGIALREYTKRCLIDEIIMTNEIEGVHSTRKEIDEILNDAEKNDKKKRLYGLVQKYALLGKEDIRLEEPKDIRKLYDELVLKEVVEDNHENKPDGIIFRKDIVYVESPTRKRIHSGIYPEEKIIEHINKGLNILKNDNYNFLIRVAIFHYVIGYIHPFYDGNGRINRFISSYLISYKLEFLVSYRLSFIIKDNLNLYYKIFKEANDEKNKGDLTKFVTEFLGIINKALIDLHESLLERYNRLDYFIRIIDKNYGVDNNMNHILYILTQNALFGEDGLDIKELYTFAQISEGTARNLLRELSQKDMISIERQGNKHMYNLKLDSLEKL